MVTTSSNSVQNFLYTVTKPTLFLQFLTPFPISVDNDGTLGVSSRAARCIQRWELGGSNGPSPVPMNDITCLLSVAMETIVKSRLHAFQILDICTAPQITVVTLLLSNTLPSNILLISLIYSGVAQTVWSHTFCSVVVLGCCLPTHIVTTFIYSSVAWVTAS